MLAVVCYVDCYPVASAAAGQKIRLVDDCEGYKN
jgi:hypothetical protein